MDAVRRIGVVAALVVATVVGMHSGSVSADREPTQLDAPCPDPVEPADIADAEQLLIGTWILCSGEVLPPLSPTEVGIQFDADGRFFRIYEGDDGNLIKVEGLDQQGEWEFIANETGTQLDLRLLGRGTFIQILELFSAPPLLQASSMGGDASLVPWTGAPPVPGVPAGIEEGPCGLPRDPVGQPPHMRFLSDAIATLDYQPTTATPVPGTPPTPAPTSPPDEPLPETGSNILLALLALGLVAGGFMLVGISRCGPHRAA